MRSGVLLLLLMSRLLTSLWAADSLRVHHQRVMFWNVENAFWPADDPARQDDDFTPDGLHHWTTGRLRHKLSQLTRVILAAGNGQGPMLVGLAEVEGDSVMRYWTRNTPLWHQHYQYIVTESPDVRGIQTALLYQPLDFRLLGWASHQVPLPAGTHPTRAVLHAYGRLVSGDTLDVMVCHLPSRLGGARQSQPARDVAHRLVRHLADSVRQARLQPRIIIMGDMNDYPTARHAWWGRGLTNLMLPLQQQLMRHPSAYGSHKYQGRWGFLDQMIVNDTCGWSDARSFSLPFLLTPDESHLGHRPSRSFYGYHYEGGYSDHLPIVVDLEVRF